MPKELEQYELPELEPNFVTEEEVRAMISGELTNFTEVSRVQAGEMRSRNFVSGISGWQLTPTSAQLNVSTAILALDIPDTTTANSFHVESDGDTFWGANNADFTSNNDNANAYVLKTGVAKFQTVTITGASSTIETSAILGSTTVEEAERGATANLPDDTNLSLYWSLDEGAALVAVDTSGNSNDGTLNGTMTDADWVTGVSGTALDLEGTDDFIDIASPSFIDDTQGAVSLWVKMDGLAAADTIWSVTVDGSNDDDYRLDFRGDVDNKLEIAYFLNGATTMQLRSADNAINDTNWHHVVLTSDGSTVRLYVDSVEQTLSVVVGSNNGSWIGDATQADVFAVGVLKRTSDVQFLDGQVDEIRVYSANLTAAEVYALYKNPSAIKSAKAVDTQNVNTVAATRVQPRAETFYEKFVSVGSAADGLVETTGGGSALTRLNLITEINSVSNGVNETCKLSTTTSPLTNTDIGWDEASAIEFFIPIRLSHTANQDVLWGLVDDDAAMMQAAGDVPADGALTDRHIAFIVVDGTLKASSADGTTQETTTVTGYTLTNWNKYLIVFDSGTDVKFYVNDTLEATHTTNIPAGAGSAQRFGLHMGIQKIGTGQATLNISNNYSVFLDA
ncbi:hypothetical protein CL633_04605 [bacterium]|jgi:hypothetical protein|nr:hypothetical protein [bacterium]|tara:strand:+ start:15695 stop:17554 length:1860 start_codon:yes stop_codon:yes gene_type:complete